MTESLNAETGVSEQGKPESYPFSVCSEMMYRLDSCFFHLKEFSDDNYRKAYQKAHQVLIEDLPVIEQYLENAAPEEVDFIFSAVLGSGYFRNDYTSDREIYPFLCSVIEKHLEIAERILLEKHSGPYSAVAVLVKFGSPEQKKKAIELWKKLLKSETQKPREPAYLSGGLTDGERRFLAAVPKEEKNLVIEKFLEYFRQNPSWRLFGDYGGYMRNFWEFFDPRQKEEALEIFLRNYCGSLKLSPEELSSLSSLFFGSSITSCLEEWIFKGKEERVFSNFPQEGSVQWKIYKAMVENLGLNYSEMVNKMTSTQINELNKLKQIPSNSAEMLKNDFIKMCQLEMQEPGICRVLNKEFGIRHFSRYPASVLLAQYQERENTQKPYGVIIYPDADWSSSFVDNYEWGGIAAFYKELCECGYLLRVCEVKNLGKLGRRLLELDRRYGSSQKISFAVIGGHGTKETIQFGGDEAGFSRKGLADRLSKATLKRERTKRAMVFFIPQPTIILKACSSYKLGAMIARLGAKVFSYRESGKIKEIRVSKNPDGSLKFEVEVEGKKGRDITAFSGPKTS